MINQEIERWLDHHGARWKLHDEIKLIKINDELSHRNQARISQPIMDEVVERYALAISEGAIFPPIVLYNQAGRFVVVDGNHRVAAAKIADKESIAGYVLTNPTPVQIQVLTYEANTRHGVPLSEEERVEHGVHLVSMGVSAVDAAKAVGIKSRILSDAIQRREADRRLQVFEPQRWTRLNVFTRRRLGSIRSDVVLEKAAKLAVEGRLSGDEINDLVTQVNAERTEVKQVEIVDAHALVYGERIQDSAGGITKRKPVSVPLLRGVGMVLASEVTQVDGYISGDDSRREEIANRFQEAALRLNSMARILRGVENGSR